MKYDNYYEYISNKFIAEQKKIQKEIAYRERQQRYKEQLCSCN